MVLPVMSSYLIGLEAGLLHFDRREESMAGRRLAFACHSGWRAAGPSVSILARLPLLAAVHTITRSSRLKEQSTLRTMSQPASWCLTYLPSYHQSASQTTPPVRPTSRRFITPVNGTPMPSEYPFRVPSSTYRTEDDDVDDVQEDFDARDSSPVTSGRAHEPQQQQQEHQRESTSPPPFSAASALMTASDSSRYVSQIAGLAEATASLSSSHEGLTQPAVSLPWEGPERAGS